jgi:Na+/proline symporter
MLTAGAVFYLMGANFHLLSIVIGTVLLVNGSFIGITADLTDEMGGLVSYAWTVCVVLPALGIVFGLLGALSVLKVRKPGVALAGGVIGMLTGLLSGLLVEGGEVSENPFGIAAFLFYLVGSGLVVIKFRTFR